MITYYCEKCKTETETSECSLCKGRAKAESKIYWCNNCNIPIYEKYCSLCGNEGSYITTDIRPVFPEERLLLEILIKEPFSLMNKSVWNGAGNRYFVNGKKINLSISKLLERDSEKIRKEYECLKIKNDDSFFKNYIERFVEANRSRYNFMTAETIDYIKKAAEGYDQSNIFISFSGGKDSTVTSDLVIKALGNPSIIHIFGNTTLEFPETIEYIKRFKKANRKTPVLTAINKDESFMDICKKAGPPSRVMRWCCVYFKTGAISRKITAIFKDRENILTFYGIRRSESVGSFQS